MELIWSGIIKTCWNSFISTSYQRQKWKKVVITMTTEGQRLHELKCAHHAYIWHESPKQVTVWILNPLLSEYSLLFVTFQPTLTWYQSCFLSRGHYPTVTMTVSPPITTCCIMQATVQYDFSRLILLQKKIKYEKWLFTNVQEKTWLLTYSYIKIWIDCDISVKCQSVFYMTLNRVFPFMEWLLGVTVVQHQCILKSQ